MGHQNLRRYLRSVLASAGCALMAAAPTFAGDISATGSLNVVPTDGGYRITASLDGRGSGTIEAKMTVLKQDGNGRVQTQQSRRIRTRKGQSDEVATSTVSLADEGTLKVTLVLSEGDRTVYRESHEVTREIP
ncbi:curli-like amyloid fiber formation chaperone CsgH [Roseovarius sp. SYSU LYC5161]|uniref:curli-like amyloid fiber formation chaperone CsgH n=1 Tax=Roseovarius halophilus (ex Wu et al. 2025) TaxID=3376060 RepID=UPI00399A75EE